MLYVGLDIHSKRISLCVLNQTGQVVHRTSSSPKEALPACAHADTSINPTLFSTADYPSHREPPNERVTVIGVLFIPKDEARHQVEIEERLEVFLSFDLRVRITSEELDFDRLILHVDVVLVERNT